MANGMTHAEFVAKFRQNRNAFAVNWISAFYVQRFLPWYYRLPWICLSVFEWGLLLGGLISLIFKHWLIGICLWLFSFSIVMPASRKTACQFILQYSLDNETFWKLMWDKGVFLERASQC